MNKPEFKKEDALRVLNKRKLIQLEGVYQLRTGGVNNIVDDKGEARTIVNLQAMTQHHVGLAMADLKEDKFSEATNHGLSTSYPTGDSRFYIPQAGELVKVEIESYENKDGVLCLGVARISPIAMSTAGSIDFSKAFETAPAEAGEGEVQA